MKPIGETNAFFLSHLRKNWKLKQGHQTTLRTQNDSYLTLNQ